MVKYILQRILLAIIVLLGSCFLVFVLLRVFTPDPSVGEGGAGKYATSEQRKAWRDARGLNEPLIIQFTDYIKKVVTGDLGKSYKTRANIAKEMSDRLPVTIELALFSLILSSVFGMLIGVAAATKKDAFTDRICMFFSSIGMSLPTFWFAILLVDFFAGRFHILPSGDIVDSCYTVEKTTGFYFADTLISQNYKAFLSFLRHLILPTISLMLSSVAVFSRITRSSVLDVLKKDYVKTAKSKGINESKVLIHHVLKNALPPVVTVIGLQFVTFLGGAVLIESIFSWPGIGKYLLDATLNSDFPVIQATVFMVTILTVFTNLIMDIMYAILDPRIRFCRKEANR
ncbi:MAG: ABC transporter permease [Oscillospiraceae bacterium]|jgi:peptide/nickel transport system permease protein|nr:ABC transporter permease [Oscillospiraceae bacterium]